MKTRKSTKGRLLVKGGRKHMVGGSLLCLVACIALGPTLFTSTQLAAPPRPHLYVHYDYLVFPDHSDEPDPKSIQLVVDAYAAHGIDLEIDNKHTAIPGQPVMSFGGEIHLCTNGQTDLYSLQSQYFHPTSNHEWHYAVFGDYAESESGRCDQSQNTGVAEINGDNFIVLMGPLRDRLNLTPLAVGGTFMHELGHNLGLNHGGNEEHNYKPNYLSVMNYWFQFGIPYAANLGSTSIAGRRLDYSDAALPTLDELHLDETIGIGAGSKDITFFLTPADSGVGPASGPIDWNQDGDTTDTNVTMDIDWFLNCLCFDVHYEQLTGFDDWAEIRGYLDGTLVHGPKTIEHENHAEEPTVTSVTPNSGPATGGTTVTITGTHFNKATKVVFGAAGEATFTIIDDKTIIAKAPPADPNGFTTDITIVAGMNPSPGIEADQFTYLNNLPVITGLNPATGPGGTVITVTGSNFSSTHDVTFYASPVANYTAPGFTVLDDHTIVVSSPGDLLGPYHVLVYNQSGTNLGHLGPGDTFTFTPPAPYIFGVTPRSGPEGGGTIVTIQGGALFHATAVRFGGTSALSFSVIDDNTITAVAPSGIGMVDIRVTNDYGTSAIRLEDEFTYLPPAPSVTSISPTSGPALGGTPITIRGTGFLSVTSVSVGPYGVAGYTIVDDTTITAVTNPAGALGPGTCDLTVTNDGGTSAPVASDRFTYF